MKIYIVEGSTGEYSDHCEWIVCAFADKTKAEELVLKATERAKKIFAEMESDLQSVWYGGDRSGKYVNEFDPGMNMGYTGTYYTYYETELRDV